jgi:hypothetical protein
MSNYSILSRDELVLINILNTMYNDNYRQIEQLQEANTRIMGSIINILSSVLNNRSRHRQGTSTNSNNTNGSIRRENHTTQNPNTNPTPQTNSTRRIHSNPLTNPTTNPTTNPVTSQNSTSDLINFLNNGIFSNSQFMVDNIEYVQSQMASRSGTNINDLIHRFLEPVEVFPTQSQIEIATRIARFSDIVNPINSSCPISMERFNDNDNVSVIRECGHIFTTQELHSWFHSNCRCPICRYDIRTYNPSSNRSQEEGIQTEIRDMSNNDVPSTDTSNNIVQSTTDMTNNVPSQTYDFYGSANSNIVVALPNMVDVSGNNLNVNDITTLLFNYYTRGTHR